MADIQYARIVGDWRRVVGDEIVSYENTEIGDVGIHGTVTLSPVWARGGPQGIVADPGAYYSIHPVVCRVRYGRLYDPTNTVPYEDVAVEIDGQPLVWKAKFELAFRRRAGEAEVPLQVREVTFDNAAMVAGEIALTGILPASAIPAEYQAYFANAALSATVADEAKTTAVGAAGTATSAASTASSAAGVADAKAAAAAASVTLAAQEADRAIGLATAQDSAVAATVTAGGPTTTALNATYESRGAVRAVNGVEPDEDGTLTIETGDPNAITSTDFAEFRLSTDPNESAPPGVVLLYMPPPVTAFTDFASAAVGTIPSGWSAKWSTARTWGVVEDATATSGKALRCASATGTAGLAWDLATDLMDGGQDGEIVWKWHTSWATVPARAAVMGADPAITCYHAGVRNGTNMAMGKFVAGTHTVSIGQAASAPWPESNLEWKITRFRKEGSNLMARSWLATDQEPETWQITATDTSITDPGWCGLLSHSAADGAWHKYDWVGVAAAGETAPKGA